MTEVLSWIIGVLLFLLVISISIGLHEGGHMVVARLFKVRVPKFFIGFGKTIWSFNRGGTEYGIKALPLGGFVQIEDESQPEESPERALLTHVSPWKRILIFFAGPAVNIILGVGILVGLLVSVPVQMVSTTIDIVNPCSTGAAESCEAFKAGLKPGDEIISLNGVEVNSVEDIVVPSDGSYEIAVLRNNEIFKTQISAGEDGLIGINLLAIEEQRSVAESFVAVGGVMSNNLTVLAELPSKVQNTMGLVMGTEERSDESLSSIVGVGKIYGDTASSTSMETESKITMLISYSGMLNIGLGLINLLPLMPLDGGRIFVAFIDSIRMGWSKLTRKSYSPIAYRWVIAMTAVTGVMVFGFMALAIVADIVAPISIT